MNFISIYILFCTINQIQNARSPSSNYQIDEFIAQLMTSEKCNELADIIAEKAAKKINNKNKNTSTLTDTSRDHKKVKNKKLKQKQNDRNLSPDSIPRQRKEDNKSGFGRINIKAFLKRGASSQELFLNYKHMTKDLKKNLETYESTKGQRSENNNIFSDHAEKNKLDSKEKLSDSGSSELKHNKANRASEENVTKPRSFTSEEKHLNSEDKNKDTTPNTFTSKEPFREHTQGKIDNTDNKTTQQTTNDDNISDAPHSEIRKNENKSEDAITNLSKEVVEVGLQALDNRSGEINEPETLVKIDYSSNESKPKPLEKQIIRRENGKFYTYLSSSDYEEYHEDVKNQQSDNRFINFK